MKILSCHIENFGKISDLRVDFSDGMHVINEPNAWGKSTLAAFIKAMFYGFESRKEAGAFEKERNLYRPWQGGVFGGELEFEVGGQAYRISRTFGKSEKADEFHLYDCVTNLESGDYSENIGEELFDLDAASFKRSVFIAQNDCMSQTTDAINAKLGNLVENTNDINNYESAQEYLKNLANQMSPNRATGSIKKRRNLMVAIEQELHSYDAAGKAVEELAQKQQLALLNKEQLVRRRDSYAKELQEASEESRRKELRKSYLGLCADHEEKLEALVLFTDIFPMGVPDGDELAEKQALARKLEEDKTTLQNLELTEAERAELVKLHVKFRKQCPTDDEVDAQLQKLKEIQPVQEERMRIEMKLSEKEHESLQDRSSAKTETPSTSVWTVIGVILALIGVAGEVGGLLFLRSIQYGLWMIIAGAVLFVSGVLLLIIGLRKRASLLAQMEAERKAWETSRRTWREEVMSLQQEEKEKSASIQQIKSETEGFLKQYLILANDGDYTSALYELKTLLHEFERLVEKNAKCEEMRGIVQKERGALLDYGLKIGQRFSEDMISDINYLQTEAAKYRMAKESAAAAEAKVKAFEAENDMGRLLREKRFTYSLEDLNLKIKHLDEEIEQVRAGIEQYSRQMEDLQEQLDLRDEKQQELADLMALQEQEQQTYNTVITTQDYLQRAREQFTARYMAPISNAFRKYYDMLLGASNSTSWQIDANISFRMKEQGELRETHWLSAGYQDLIGICMRLALVDAMYQGEKPFLILDDPFVNLDEEKTNRGMELLMAVSEEYQILYFTCHSSREPK